MIGLLAPVFTAFLAICSSACASRAELGSDFSCYAMPAFPDATPQELTADVLYQIGALEALCRVAGTRVAYVKPHGALYNRACRDRARRRRPDRPVEAGNGGRPVVGGRKSATRHYRH